MALWEGAGGSSSRRWPAAGKRSAGVTRPPRLVRVTCEPWAHPRASQTHHPRAGMHTSHTHTPPTGLTHGEWESRSKAATPSIPGHHSLPLASLPWAARCAQGPRSHIFLPRQALPLGTQKEPPRAGRTGPRLRSTPVAELRCFLKAGAGPLPLKMPFLIYSSPWGKLRGACSTLLPPPSTERKEAWAPAPPPPLHGFQN